MERHTEEKEKLNVPGDFTAAAVSRNAQRNLMPPSHFTSTFQATGNTATSWINPALVSALPVADPSSANPWLALAQAKQEILELRKENGRIMRSQGEGARGRNPIEQTDSRTRMGSLSLEGREQSSGLDAGWRVEVEKQRAETERLRGQVETLKEMAERQREERRAQQSVLNRQSHELEALREELCQAKTDLSHARLELTHNTEERERLSSQLEMQERESGVELARLRGDAERSRREAQRLALEVQKTRLQAEEEAGRHAQSLAQQLEDLQSRQEAELQQVTTSYSEDLASVRHGSSELQDRLHSMTSEVVQLKSSLTEASTERDDLQGQLSQMAEAFKAQSATLQSLRNYIGQLSPERGQEERLGETVQRLNKENEALRVTTELLNVRLNSVKEILTLQEETMVKKTLSDPLLMAGSKGTLVLRLWREKVFKLCVQLRSKDLELRAEKDNLLSTIRCLEQQVGQEQHQASVLQHSLQDRVAALHLEGVARETVEQDLAGALKENTQLKSCGQKAEGDLMALTEAVQRFSLVFESKVADIDTAQTRLDGFTQRLTFAKRRVETIQGLMMRGLALRKVQQATRSADQTAGSDSIRSLQAELVLVCEERDKLTQELRRTPELVEKALADLRDQSESKVRQQQQALERTWVEVQEAVSSRDEAQRRLQEAQMLLEESSHSLEQLVGQQEQSELALQQRVSETERGCAERLREMEAQLNSARREHTKAVMALRQFERRAGRERDQEGEARRLQNQHAQGEVEDLRKQLQEMGKDNSLLLAVVQERGLLSEYRRARTIALQTSAALEARDQVLEMTSTLGAKLSAKESLVSVLEDLQALRVAVVNSSEDSAEEDGQADGVVPQHR